MRKLMLLGSIALLSACSERSKPPAPSSPPAVQSATATAAGPMLLSAEGVGALRFGMTLAEAEQAAGTKAELPKPLDPACSMVRFPALPKLRFMVENDIVTRADAEPGVGNAAGIAVGDTLEQVRARHPQAQVSPHKYDTKGHTLTIPGADGRGAIVLEASGGTVTKVRAGLQPAVAYVETCG
ncbi:MAG: hypothetical protein ACREWI_14440 [Telluria sp.]